MAHDLAVYMWCLALFPCTQVLSCIGATTVLWWLFPGARWGLAAYFVWIVFDPYPGKAGYQFAQRSGLTDYLRSLNGWKRACSYFPISLTRTAPLPADRSYLLCCHPHGVVGISAMQFGSEGTGFSRLFPGLRCYLMGLAPLFRIPFFREWIMLHGCGVPESTTITSLLRQRGTAVALAIGGAREAFEAEPGTFRLVLRTRKGFVKAALRSGASLVPVLTFGENELYTVNTALFRRPRERLQRLMGFALPVFCGAARWFPIAPLPTPMRTVVGAPLRGAGRSPGDGGEPTAAEVDALHARYVEALRALYHEHRDANGYGAVAFEIVD